MKPIVTLSGLVNEALFCFKTELINRGISTGSNATRVLSILNHGDFRQVDIETHAIDGMIIEASIILYKKGDGWVLTSVAFAE